MSHGEDGTVPQQFRGLWRRIALERADGTGDVTSLVLWLQTATLYVDLRIPLDRPPARDFDPNPFQLEWHHDGPPETAQASVSGANSFRPEDSTWSESARALARQEGFAGRFSVRDGVARWERRIDYRPIGAPDEGHLCRERRVMTEHGLHDDYVEHWWLGAPGEGAAVLADTPRTIVVRLDDHLMLAREARATPPTDLGAALRSARDLRSVLDCEVSYARREGTDWTVIHSTLPWREGTRLTARDLHPQAQS